MASSSVERVGVSAIGEGKRRGELYSRGFMRAVDLIRTKRDGGQLDRASLEWFVTGVTGGSLPDYPTSSVLLAGGRRAPEADRAGVPDGGPVPSSLQSHH